MQYKSLGNSDLIVSAIGLGCMGMSEFYGSTNLKESRKTLHVAARAGINFFDTADSYGFGDNELLVGGTLRCYPRHELVIASKGGILRDRNDATKRGVDNSPKYLENAIDGSLDRLDMDYIDLYYVHRIANQGRDIEETIYSLAKCVRAGKIRHIGLSEADVETIRRAHSVHPITAVQTEYSLWRRGPEKDGVLDLCRELGIAFVPYSPLGRGFLTGKITTPTSLEEGDFRRFLPRFQKENFEHNRKLVEKLEHFAREKRCTPAQLALAWVLAQGENIVPIPGTKRVKYLLENITALKVHLTPEDLQKLDAIAPPGAAKGLRYTSAAMEAYGFQDDL